MIPITYLRGDATKPQGEGPKVIAHICNDSSAWGRVGGLWGRGFVVALSRRWLEPEQAYQAWALAKCQPDFKLGEVQFVHLAVGLWVANMLAQHGLNLKDTQPPIRYAALESCLRKLAEHAIGFDCSVHMPRIGCGLAGGTWDQVEPIIQTCLAEADIAVFVYDL